MIANDRWVVLPDRLSIYDIEVKLLREMIAAQRDWIKDKERFDSLRLGVALAAVAAFGLGVGLLF